MPAQKLTWTALAAELNVNPSSLHAWKVLPDAPKGRDPDEWRAFLQARHQPPPTTALPDGVSFLPGTCEYDKAVAAGQITYQDAIRREEARGKVIANEVARGQLVTKDDAEKACALVRDDLERRFTRTVTLLVGMLSNLPAETRVHVETCLPKAWDKAAEDV